jgi:hypothetical protein
MRPCPFARRASPRRTRRGTASSRQRGQSKARPSSTNIDGVFLPGRVTDARRRPVQPKSCRGLTFRRCTLPGYFFRPTERPASTAFRGVEVDRDGLHCVSRGLSRTSPPPRVQPGQFLDCSCYLSGMHGVPVCPHSASTAAIASGGSVVVHQLDATDHTVRGRTFGAPLGAPFPTRLAVPFWVGVRHGVSVRHIEIRGGRVSVTGCAPFTRELRTQKIRHFRRVLPTDWLSLQDKHDHRYRGNRLKRTRWGLLSRFARSKALSPPWIDVPTRTAANVGTQGRRPPLARR